MRAKQFVIAALLAAVVGGGVLFYFFRWRHSVGLPEVDLTGAEPDVCAVIESARERVAKEPSSADAWGHLGQALLANGYDDDALPVLERAAQLDPAQPRWPYLRARRLLTIDRVKGRELLERAVRLAERSDPDNVSCKLLLAEAYGEQNDHQRAKELAEEVLAKEPNNPRAHFDLGSSYLQLDEPKRALPHLLRAAESPYIRKRACIFLAAVSLRLGDQSASEQFTKQMRELPNDLPPVDAFVAEYLTLTAGRQARFREAERLEAEKRLHDSVRLLQELTDAQPDARSGVALGIALIKLGNHAGAEKVLRDAVAHDPDSPAAHYALAVAQFNQAEALRQQGEPAATKYREVERSGLAALAAKPDHAPAHLVVGRARRHLRRRDEAIDSFRKAIACRPELAGPHLALGEALAEAGRLDEARRELQQAVTLAASSDPETGRQAREALARLDKP